MPVHMPSTLGTRRGLMPHNDEACRVHTHDVVQHTPATQRGPALPSHHPQIYRQTRTFLARTGSLGAFFVMVGSLVRPPPVMQWRACTTRNAHVPRPRTDSEAVGGVVRRRCAGRNSRELTGWLRTWRTRPVTCTWPRARARACRCTSTRAPREAGCWPPRSR
jgi:hypothetical protein